MGVTKTFDVVMPISSEDIILAQKGNNVSWNKIVSFLLPRAKAHAYMLYPLKAATIQECDLQVAFFAAIERSVSSFKPGNKRFENYYLTVYQHELCKIFEENSVPEQVTVFSMESTIPDSDDTLIFADSIASSTEDDKTYLDVEYAAKLYKETIEKLGDELAVRVADLRRKNMTFQEIAEALGITTRVAWQKFQKYVSAMKRAFKDM